MCVLQTTEGRIETSPSGALPDCHVGHVLVPAPRGVGGAARPAACVELRVYPDHCQSRRSRRCVIH